MSRTIVIIILVLFQTIVDFIIPKLDLLLFEPLIPRGLEVSLPAGSGRYLTYYYKSEITNLLIICRLHCTSQVFNPTSLVHFLPLQGILSKAIYLLLQL